MSIELRIWRLLLHLHLNFSKWFWHPTFSLGGGCLTAGLFWIVFHAMWFQPLTPEREARFSKIFSEMSKPSEP